MIIACPACGTKYVVPDDALGVEGRTVRCAKCKHSWFQDGPALDLPEPAHTNDPPTSAGAQDTHAAVASQPIPVVKAKEPAEQPEPAKPAQHTARPAAVPADDSGHPPLPDAALRPPPFYRASDNQPAASRKTKEPSVTQDESDYASFDYQPPFRPRRNRLRLFTYAAAAFAGLALLAVAAMQLWGLPSWLPSSQPLFAGEEAGLAMSFPEDRQQTRPLPTGGEFLSVSGTLANTGRETRAVPPVLIVLRDARNRVVYSQEIAPPKRNLAPGETAEVNEAIADIPQSAVAAEFGWAPR